MTTLNEQNFFNKLCTKPNVLGNTPLFTISKQSYLFMIHRYHDEDYYEKLIYYNLNNELQIEPQFGFCSRFLTCRYFLPYPDTYFTHNALKEKINKHSTNHGTVFVVIESDSETDSSGTEYVDWDYTSSDDDF